MDCVIGIGDIEMAPKTVQQQSPDWTISQEELDRLVSEHHGTIDDITVTPVMAEYILKTYNSGNRILRTAHANSFARALVKGRWQNTGEAIIFAAEGILNNGQHRLEGVMRSGIAAKMDLRFGIPRKAFAVTDTGAKRGPGDVLSISGAVNHFATAAALRLLLAYEEGLPAAYRTKLGNDEVLDGYRRWPDITKAIQVAHTNLVRPGLVNASSATFTFLAIRQSDIPTTEKFLVVVESGVTQTKNDPARMLRERLLFSQGVRRGGRDVIIERLALFIKAWSLWRAGKTTEHLRWSSKENFPVMKGVKLTKAG